MKRCSRALTNVLSLLILATPFPALAKRTVLDRSLVTVNDDIILESDVDKFRQKAKSKNFQDLFGGLDPKKLENKDAVLELLVEEKLIDQQVKKLELGVTDQDIDRQIRTITTRTGITEAQLKIRLKDLGTSFPEYRDGIRRQLERRNLVDREIKPMLEVSEEELRHFMMRNGSGDTGHRYEVAHILVAKKGPQAKPRAEKILAEAMARPDEFSKLALEYSDDQATAKNGGNLGVLSTDSMAADFRDAVRNTAPGKVFPKVVKTPGGLHILKVIKSQAMSFADLPEDKKNELRNQLMAQELEKKMALWLERKKGEAHIRKSGSLKEMQGGA